MRKFNTVEDELRISDNGTGTIGEKVLNVFFIEKPCSILPKCSYIYCPGTLLDHLIFTPDFKMVTLSFLIFPQNIVILN